jgi:Alpha/beta hydrolase domain
MRDPRLSVEERYASESDYVARVESAAKRLVEQRLMLEEDIDQVVARAHAHWAFAMRSDAAASTATN